MIQTDCHTHSSFSSDSSTPVEAMIEKAVSLGFDTFYLTDHMDFDFPWNKEGLTFVFSPSDYFEKLTALRKRYQQKIAVRTGIELGLRTTESVMRQINELLDAYSFDVIIGSTHLVDNLDPYHASYWENRSEKEGLTKFFEATLTNIITYPTINVLGHLDYAIRYAPSKGASFSYHAYKSILDEILVFLIAHDIALEVNTAGFKYGLGKPNPGPDIIKRYLQLGGDLISIGSDGHVPEFYGYQFDETRKLLLGLGVTAYATFENGVVTKRPL